MQGLWSTRPGWGIAAVRITAGLILIVAGWSKLAPGLTGFTGFVTQLGFPAPGLVAPFVAWLELIGGILLLIGLGTRWIALLFLVEFIVTAFAIQLPRGGLTAGRADLMLLAASVLFVLAGAGKASVDEWLAQRQGQVRRKPLHA